MPRYTFELQDGTSPIEDGSGVWLAERKEALRYAEAVARELMRGCEREARSWRLDVYEDGTRVEEIPFAGIDPTLDHLHPALRTAVERSCDTVRSFREAMSAARTTMRESRALVARSRGKLYLATEAGQPTIRTSPPVSDRSNRRRGTGSKGE